jgi:N-dimethylarginine dimethylaminohydrolase
MDTEAAVDTELAVKQWSMLRELLVALGHTVDVLDPVPGLPGMVFAANGAFSWCCPRRPVASPPASPRPDTFRSG